MKLISFRRGSEWFAINADSGMRVMRRTSITPIAASPAYIAGITSMNGQVVTILLLERIFGIELNAPDSDRYCIILKPEKGEENLTGFMADAPIDIVECDAPDIKPPFHLKDNAVAPHISGLLTHQEAILKILDIEGILMMKRGEKA